MAHFKMYPRKEKESKIILDEGIVEDIVVLAINELDNVELFSNGKKNYNLRNSIVVSRAKEGLIIDVDIVVHYPQTVADIAFKVQETLRHNIEAMTENHVSVVNVNVKDVLLNTQEKTPEGKVD